jgi:hypothetical protein
MKKSQTFQLVLHKESFASSIKTQELEGLITKYKDVFVKTNSDYEQTKGTTVWMLEKPYQFDNPEEVPSGERGRSGQDSRGHATTWGDR